MEVSIINHQSIRIPKEAPIPSSRKPSEAPLPTDLKKWKRIRNEIDAEVSAIFGGQLHETTH